MKGLIASLAVGALLFITGIAAAGASDVVDGATTTLTYSTTNADGSTYTDPKGVAHADVAVFDRQ